MKNIYSVALLVAASYAGTATIDAPTFEDDGYTVTSKLTLDWIVEGTTVTTDYTFAMDYDDSDMNVRNDDTIKFWLCDIEECFLTAFH